MQQLAGGDEQRRNAPSASRLIRPSASILIPVVDAETSALTIQQFVARTWTEGVPFAVAEKFTDADVPYLEQFLKDPAQMDKWQNAVAVLGAIGSMRAKYALMSFLLAAPDNTLSLTEYKDRRASPSRWAGLLRGIARTARKAMPTRFVP